MGHKHLILEKETAKRYKICASYLFDKPVSIEEARREISEIIKENNNMIPKSWIRMA